METLSVRGLEYWINPRHLLPESTERLAAAFADDPMDTIWLDDFLLPEHFSRLRRLFTDEGEFREIYSVYDDTAKGGVRKVDAEEWRTTDPARWFHHELKFLGPKPEHRLGLGIVTYLRYGTFLQSAAHLAFLHRITGIGLGGISSSLMRITRHGHRLERHSDVSRHRRLCSILYLSDGWNPAFGGRLRQFRADAPPRSLDPLPNRLALFRPSVEDEHEVEHLTDQAIHYDRCAMTTWYHGAEDSPDAGRPDAGPAP